MEYLIGIDIGTYGSKGVLVDGDGKIVASSSVSHEMSIPRAGWAEHDADEVWWNDFVRLCRDLLNADHGSGGRISPEKVAAVGCSGIGPCVLPVGADGKPLRPAILYGIDTRAAAEVRELTGLLGEEWILEQTGSALSSQAAGPKILWLRRREPEVWERTDRIMTSTSYLVYRLTGRIVIDHYTAAAYGPLYNLHTRDWEPRGLEQVCPRKVLPELEWSGALAGKVTCGAAEETGLAEGTPVTVGTADAAAEAAAEVPAGAEGLLMLPYFSGERTPINDPLARGVVAGLSLTHTRAHLYRALLEGVAFGIRLNLEVMQEAGASPERLFAIGGAVMHPLWPQIVSDVTGRPQVVKRTPGASYGDAVLAAAGAPDDVARGGAADKGGTP